MRKERVFSLKGMMKKIFRRWYLVLICGILFACLFGGYEWHKKMQEMRASEEAEAESEEAETDNASSDFSSEQDMTMESLKQKDEYLNNSIIAKIDPNKEGVATVLFSVSLDGDESSDNGSVTLSGNTDNSDVSYNADGSAVTEDGSTDSDSSNVEAMALSPETEEEDTILQSYVSRILNNIDWTEMADKLETEPEYLSQLVSVSDTDQAAAQVQIKVIYVDEEGATEILNYLIGQIQDQKEEVVSETEPHSIAFGSKTQSTIVDSTLFGWLNSRISEMNNLMSSLDTFDTASNALNPSDTSHAAVITQNDVVTASAQYGTIGFVVGVLLWIVLGMACLLIRGRVISADDFVRQYDLKQLGVLAGKHKKTGQSATASEMYQIAVLRIRHQMKEGGCIAVVSDLDEEAFLEVKEGLEEAEKAVNGDGDVNKYVCLSRPENNPESLLKLEKVDGAVVVAKEDKTRYSEMDKVLQAVDECGKTVLGCIVGEV